MKVNIIKSKNQWKKYYNPEFDWEDFELYADNILFENFIREFKDKVDWYYISEYQKLSEDFIREFKDNVNWKFITKYQKLTKAFIREFKK